MRKFNKILYQLKNKKRFFSFGIWVVINNSVNPLILIITTPFLYNNLSKEEYGLFALIQTFILFAPLMTFGIPSTAIKFVSEKVGQDKIAEAFHIARIAMVLSLVISTLILVTLFTFTAEITSFFDDSFNQSVNIRLAFTLGFILLFFQGIDDMLIGIIHGTFNFKLGAIIELSTRIPLGISIIISTYLHHSLIEVLVIMMFSSLVKTTLRVWALKKMYNQNLLSGVFDKKIAKQVLIYTKWLFLQNLGSHVFSSADKLLIGSFLGASELARYNICTQIPQYVFSISNSFMSTLFPLISAKQAKNKEGTNYIPLKQVLSLCIISTLPLLFIYVISNHILTIWINEDFSNNNYSLFIALIGIFFILSVSIPFHYILMGLGKIKLITIASIFAITITLLMMYYLLTLGIIGLLYSKLFYSVLLFLLFLYFYKRTTYVKKDIS